MKTTRLVENIAHKIEKLLYRDITHFEHRLLLLSTGIIATIAFICTLIDIFLGFEVVNIILTFLSFIIYSVLFHLGYVHYQFNVVKWVTIIFTYLFLNAVWLFSHNSNGPVLLFFLVFLCFIIFICNTREIIILTSLITVNLVLIFLVELSAPKWLTIYESNHRRIIDMYTGVFISAIMLAAYTLKAKFSHKKQYRKAKQSDDLKTAFITNMSHEIRTPLNAIVGFSELIVNSRIDDSKRKDYINLIKSNNKYLLNLISDILDIAKIESHQLNLRYHKFRIDPVFKKLQYELAKEIDLKQKEIDIKYIQSDEELTIVSDRIRFEQVARSILSNALKFTQTGEIKLGFEQGKDFIYFFIEDTGTGIDSKNINSIFERFTKINEDKNALYRGTGVGLYLVKSILTMLGGDIKVESEIGKGTRFIFWLPKGENFKLPDDLSYSKI